MVEEPFKIDLYSSVLNVAKNLKPKRAGGVFDGLEFNPCHFAEIEEKVLKIKIAQHGGSVGNSKNSRTLIPFTHVPDAFSDAVTEYWIEKCIQANRLVELSESILFRPYCFKLPLEGQLV
jgi:hypothetical protein